MSQEMGVLQCLQRRFLRLICRNAEGERGWNLFCQLLADIGVMLGHVKRKSMLMPDELRTQLVALFETTDGVERGRLDAWLARREAGGGTATKIDITKALDLAVGVHGQLGRLIAPATPESIRASSIGGNGALLFAVSLGVAGITILIATALASVGALRLSDSPPNPETLKYAQNFGAAAIGSAFYALYTASAYLREGTFEPKYVETYMIRCVLGIFAGFILGSFPDLMNNGSKADMATTARLGALTLALIGGFAAEAVAAILQRIADTLVTIVRGSGQERAEAAAEKDKVKLKADIATQLQDVMTLADAPKMQEQIKKIIAQAMK